MTLVAGVAELDRADPLARYRDLFQLDQDVVYLDGNSLGAMPRAVPARVEHFLLEEWGRGGVRSWNDAGWAEAATRVGDKLGRLLGAQPGEVIVADNTTVNLYKALAAALQHTGGGVILTDAGNFPTDLYITRAVAERFGPAEVRAVRRDGIPEAIAPGTSVLSATHVDYRTGDILDLPGLTAAAHDAGALVVWDLCHSAGAVPVDLGAAGVDLAVGCTYKHLNGGPGAPAFLYVSHALQERLETPIPGWMGHADTFAFAPDYTPAVGAARFQSGTPSIPAIVGLEVAVDLWLTVDISAVRQKAIALGKLLIETVLDRCLTFGLELASPRDPERRGGQVTFRHPQAYGLVQALAERGVVCDHRPPDLVRMGITPLYLRYEDVDRAAEVLVDVLRGGAHLEPRHGDRRLVP